MIIAEKERAEEGANRQRKVPRKTEMGHDGNTSDCVEGAEGGMSE